MYLKLSVYSASFNWVIATLQCCSRFLLHNKVNQPMYIIHPNWTSLPPLPPSHPLKVITGHRDGFPPVYTAASPYKYSPHAIIYVNPILPTHPIRPPVSTCPFPMSASLIIQNEASHKKENIIH